MLTEDKLTAVVDWPMIDQLCRGQVVELATVVLIPATLLLEETETEEEPVRG